MKKIFLFLVVMLFSSMSFAQHRGHSGYNHHRGPGFGWYAAPLIVGGLVGYGLSRSQTVVVQQQPVIVYQSPLQAPLVSQPIYQKTLVWDAICNCWQEVYTRIQ